VQSMVAEAGTAKSGSAWMNGSAFSRSRSTYSAPQVSSEA
jgi:hypothetical protein